MLVYGPRGGIMSNIIDKILELIIESDGKNIDIIQNLLDGVNDLKANDYFRIIYALLCKYNLEDIDSINKIFINKPKFKISTYKKLLKIEAEKQYDELRKEKDSLLVSLSRNLCSQLEKKSVKEVLEIFHDNIAYIEEVMSSSELIHLIKEYKTALNSYDQIRISDARTKIREFDRMFNIRFKDYFIKNYINTELDKIKDDFIPKKQETKLERIDVELFKKLFINDKIISNSFKVKTLDLFGIEITNDDIKFIIHNIINGKDELNYKLLEIDNSLDNYYNKLIKLQELKAYHRLNNYYLSIINANFKTINPFMVAYLLENIDCIKDYESELTKSQINLLKEISIIYKEAKATCMIDGNIKFIKEEVTDLEFKELKLTQLNYNKYLSLKNMINEYYVRTSKSRNRLLDDNSKVYPLIFDDDNYKIKKEELYLDIRFLCDVLSKIDKDVVSKYNNELVEYLKKILFDQGLIFAKMKYGINIDINSIINNIGKIKIDKNEDIDCIIKKTSIYSFVDDFTIALLGEKNTYKLINNRQFLQSNKTEDIERRIDKALDISVRGANIKSSAIPYNIDTTYEDITISRYNNDDPRLLVSGIDTNTCFKLDGNDNDFVIYTVINKNGGVLKIYHKDKFEGRMSIFRNANVVYINSIRTKDEKETNITKDIIDKNKNILKCVEQLSEKLISNTTNDQLPIDYVVCNKAGILESSYFDLNYDLVPEHIIDRSLDTYNEDWQEFVHTYDKYSNNYFGQVYDGSVFTTDFGSYPAMLIKSRDNRPLQRLFDISYDVPQAVYKRNEIDITVTDNFDHYLNYIYRIDALKLLSEVDNIALARKIYQKRELKDIVSIHIKNYSYHIIFKNGKELYNEYKIDNEIIKKLVK